jgi:hypothetical protein
MTPRRMDRLQYGLSRQLDLACEGRLPKRPRRGEWSGRAVWCALHD